MESELEIMVPVDKSLLSIAVVVICLMSSFAGMIDLHAEFVTIGIRLSSIIARFQHWLVTRFNLIRIRIVPKPPHSLSACDYFTLNMPLSMATCPRLFGSSL